MHGENHKSLHRLTNSTLRLCLPPNDNAVGPVAEWAAAGQ